MNKEKSGQKGESDRPKKKTGKQRGSLGQEPRENLKDWGKFFREEINERIEKQGKRKKVAAEIFWGKTENREGGSRLKKRTGKKNRAIKRKTGEVSAGEEKRKQEKAKGCRLEELSEEKNW